MEAKFRCTSVQTFEAGSDMIAFAVVATVMLVSAEPAEGELPLSITIEHAPVGQFKAGREYSLEIKAAE